LKEPIIPKRGEKDFEPASEDRYIDLQDSLLEASRSALFSAISSGTRHHSSKGPNRAIWDPLLERAYMVHVSDPSLPPFASSSSSSSSETPHAQDNNPNAAAVHGIHFSTVGKFVQERKRLELMPEEALYLIERGSIECWTSEDETAVPLSVQHAWAVMISAGKLTPERYQVYAFLKRLGYTVVRSDTVPNPVNRKEGLHHATFVSTKAWIHNAFTTIFYPAAVLLRRIKHTIAPYTLTALERLDSIANGQRQSLLGSERWSTYGKF
jgi:tRNA-splicing endonuclease subunit Sen54